MTRNGRFSWLGVGLLAGVVLPVPHAAQDREDRLQILGEYPARLVLDEPNQIEAFACYVPILETFGNEGDV